MQFRLISLRYVLVAIAIGIIGALLYTGSVYEKDFLQDYLLARAVIDGTDPYIGLSTLAAPYADQAVRDRLGPLPTPHPPTVALLVLPLAYLPYHMAAIAWLAIELACLAVTIAILLPARWYAIVILAWLPILADLESGQLMIPLLLILSSMYVAMRSGHHVLGGVILGLSFFLKPIAWPLLLVFMIKCRPAATFASVYVALIGYSIAALVFSPETLFDYLTRALPMVTSYYLIDQTYTNYSLWKLGVPAVAAAFVLGLAVTVRSKSIHAPVAAMTLVAILISPIVWSYYFVLTLLPLAITLRSSSD